MKNNISNYSFYKNYFFINKLFLIIFTFIFLTFQFSLHVNAISSKTSIKQTNTANIQSGQNFEEIIITFNKNKINLKSSNGISKAKAFGKKFNLNYVSDFKSQNFALFKVKLNKGDNLEKIMKKIKTYKEVEYIQKNFKYAPQTNKINPIR